MAGVLGIALLAPMTVSLSSAASAATTPPQLSFTPTLPPPGPALAAPSARQVDPLGPSRNSLPKIVGAAPADKH
ncbi:MAG: hypothetical protein ACRDYC_12525, partial [Acidimicrobiales bacterium]